MKKNINNIINKIMIISLSLLMMIGTIFQNVVPVDALSVTMNTYNYLAGVTQKEGAKMNDGTILDASTYSQGLTVLLTTNGQFLYCLEHGKGVHNGDEYNSQNSLTMIKEAQKNTAISASQKQQLIARVLSIAPQNINVDYNNSGSLKGVKGNTYQWMAAQIIVWEIMVGERNADGSYRGVTTSGATSVFNGFNWDNSTVKNNVKKYYDDYSNKLINWAKIPSFATRTTGSAKTYSLTEKTGNNFFIELTDNNHVLDMFDFKANGVTFEKNGNILKVTLANTNETITVSGTNTLEKNAKQLLCFNTASGNQKVAKAGATTDPQPSAYFKVKIGTGNLEISKKDNKGNYVPNTQFKLFYNPDMSSSLGTYTTGSNGKVMIEELKPTTIYIQEISVPSHLVLDNTVHQFNVIAGQTVSYTATNNWKQGYIQVVKKDNKTGEIVKKSGTKFEVLSGNQVVTTISTNSEGVAKTGLIDYGTYTIREKEAPQNYVIATLEKNQSVTENGKTYAIEIYNEPVLGQIELQKHDNKTGNNAQGDATLKDAEYVLKANSDVLNPADGSIIYSKDEVISQKTIGNGVWGDTGTKKTDSNAKITWSNLPMGTYRIEETKPSEGYLIDKNTYTVTLSSTNSTQQIVTKNAVSKEQVIKGKLEVAKMGSDGTSGVVQGLAGVEFTMKLYSDVQKNGWDNAKTYDVLVTDKTGRDTSIDVPYGTYQVKETKTPENYYPAGDFFVTIDQDGEIEYRMVNNAPFKAWLKIVKTDNQGQKVTLSHATFKLKDEEGNYVKQKVGLFYKDEWTTDEKGYVVLDNMIESGTYTIEELKTPEGFLIGNDIKVNISSDNDEIYFDQDNQPVIEVSFVDEKPTGHLILYKTFELDKDTAVGGAQFKVTADSDIVDPATGEIIYHAGDPVSMGNSTDGIYMIDESGKLELKDLPLGTTGAKYKVEEIKTVDGYVLLDKPVIFEFDIKDNTTKEYTVEKTVKNKLTETYFSKQDLNGKELKGGEYSVIDAETEEVIDQWTSDGRTHLVKGLVIGKDYIYREDLTPLGYTYAKDVKFTMSENKQTIVMKDTQVDVNKLDVDGNVVQGATLQIVSDKTKNIVDQWITDGTTHHAEGLVVGETYILREIKTPQNYTTANEIQFTVKEDEDMSLNMIDKKVVFEKKDVNGNVLEGAELQVIDAETEEIVDTWITSEESYDINNLVVGKVYILREISAPEGKTIAKDVKFEVNDENKNQYIQMIDTQVDVNKLDVDDNAVKGATLQVVSTKTKNIVDQWVTDGTNHHVDGLKVGETYIIREVKTPEGFVTANEIQFTVKEDSDMSLSMIDKKVIFSKQDAGGEEIEGASMKVIDKETEEVVDEWISTKDSHEINNLVAGKTYIIHEDLAPIGKNLAQDIEFTVNDDNQDQHITMIDTAVGIQKKDDLGNSVKGATLQIVNNKTKNIVDQWVTDGTTHYAEGLIAGETYTIAEVKTPDGFETAEPITFTVNDQQDMLLTMTDNRILTDILVNKVDSFSLKNIISKDFAFTMYSDPECTKVIKTVHADKEKGIALFEDLEYGQTVYIKETSAPLGYELSNEVKEIVLDDNLEGIGKVHSFMYLNTLLPTTEVQTSDMTNIILPITLFSFAGAGIIYFRRKKDEI